MEKLEEKGSDTSTMADHPEFDGSHAAPMHYQQFIMWQYVAHENALTQLRNI